MLVLKTPGFEPQTCLLLNQQSILCTDYRVSGDYFSPKLRSVTLGVGLNKHVRFQPPSPGFEPQTYLHASKSAEQIMYWLEYLVTASSSNSDLSLLV